MTLAIADCHDRIHVDVVDAGSDSTPRIRGAALSEGGRGLLLVARISSSWGVYDHQSGRTIWFQIEYRRGNGPSNDPAHTNDAFIDPISKMMNPAQSH
ncbi:ATP-binding protein [Sphaerisporangium aureirubrum]|uniref:ATP-binding protein n=1 Tax=Sphaerisporangium aureirubrum TaxID=1544736 RepID=A0ABW1NGW8_9ACTN